MTGTVIAANMPAIARRVEKRGAEGMRAEIWPWGGGFQRMSYKDYQTLLFVTTTLRDSGESVRNVIRATQRSCDRLTADGRPAARSRGFPRRLGRPTHSHSIVAGGLEVMS